MSRIFLISILLTLSTLSVNMYGQETTTLVSGTVLDTAQAPLMAATVTLLKATDSVLVAFSLSDKTGKFAFKKVKPGDYILQITYIGFRQKSVPVSVKGDTPEINLGTISLEALDVSLGEVTIEGRRTPILINKDTIEYNADAFQTQPNAVVEDLLRKLPGVEVEQDGTIKAQGKEVRKVYVDGKEFFGDDPKIASKNLPADAVDKVQVYDKKSDFAEFTGIDDGQREKTINLALKEDKKKGVFGNVSGGYGTQNRYEGRANVNRFTKKLQFSGLGMLNNTNQQGFGIDDYINFMGGLQNMMSSGGGGGGGSFRISLNATDLGLPINNGPGAGFTTTSAGGLNFNYDFNKKTKLTSNYFYSGIKNEKESSTFRQNFLGENTFDSQENTDQISRNQNHRVNMTLRHEIDSFKNIIFRSNFGFNDAGFDIASDSRVYNPLGLVQNSNDRTNASEGNNISFRNSFTYRQRFAKKGRAIVASANVGIQDDEKEAWIESLNRYWEVDSTFSDSLSQEQIQRSDQLDYSARLTYTEPLGKGKFLAFNLSHQNYGNKLIRDVFDIRPNDIPQQILNTDLSNHYQRGYFYERAGVDFQYNRKKFNFTTGVNFQQSRLRGEILTNGTTIRQNFLNILPVVRANYDFTTSTNLGFDYETSVQEPSLEQLQPIADNSNPLSIVVGNPNLRPEYSHQMNLRFNSYSAFTFTSLFANLEATYTQNKITHSRSIDSLFRQVTMPVNVARDLRLSGSVSFGTPIKPLKSRINLDLRTLYNRGILFVNSQENNVDRLINSAGLSIENRNKEVVDIVLGVDYDHNLTRYSESSDLNQAFANQRYYADFSLNFAKTWAVRTGMDYAVYAGTAFNEETRIPLWRASVSKYVLKNRRGEIKLSAFDMLNQNLGFSRTSELNYIEEVQTLTLSRYFLLSFTYNLSKFGAAGEPGGSGIRIIQRK
ncbi:MAG: TonB-dependent receptor [Bacteroidia bacterium]|nr:TonB-dependent receptor [Bacteroidia bacterium]